MELNTLEVFKLLKAKGMNELFHANTVATSCGFLEKGALISRGSMERLGLKQTPQYTDSIDKYYSLWYDIFLDSSDIHYTIKDINQYGPVLFVIDLAILNNAANGNVWITKCNPTEWKNVEESKRWFVSLKDVEDNYSIGVFGYHLVFRHCGGELNIKEHLKEIVLDNPQMLKPDDKSADLYTFSSDVLLNSLKRGGFNISITQRSNCQPACICDRTYKHNKDLTIDKFYP